MNDGGSLGGSCDSAAHARSEETTALSEEEAAPATPPEPTTVFLAEGRISSFLAQASRSSSSRDAWRIFCKAKERTILSLEFYPFSYLVYAYLCKVLC